MRLLGFPLAVAVLTCVVTVAPEAGESPFGNQLVCGELERDVRAKARRQNTRTLNEFLFAAAEKGCIALAERLLGAGASVDARDRGGNTVLLRAAAAGEEEAVERLLAADADIEATNLIGNTALLRAAVADQDDTVAVLLDAGADPGARNSRGLTALMAAAYNGNMGLVERLLAVGADPAAVDSTGKGPAVYAAGRGYARVLTRLIEAGLPVDKRYAHDLTALMWAAGHANDVPAQEGIGTAATLLDAGARIDLADDRGRTALMTAAARGHAKMVAFLLRRGADPGLTDAGGRTARDLAANDAVRALLEGS